MTTAPVRIGIVGLGPMGLRHARCVAAHPDATLAMAAESDPARAVADIGCAVVADAARMIGHVDAAIVAVPTAFHAAVAVPLLHAGIDCLIEKPFVGTPEEAERIAAAARAGRACVRVAHVERFNPAVVALMRNVPQDFREITARRMSAASARVVDIDVILDLMVHDLDVILALKPQAVTHVTATGTRNHVTALLSFADGTHASVIASRIALGLTRDLELIGHDFAVRLDYAGRSLSETRREEEGLVTRPRAVEEHDALTAQLSAFLEAREGAAVGVTAEQAMATMDLAWRIQAALAL